jgi:hypothetical protein
MFPELITFTLYHVAIMPLIEFGKSSEGVRHPFLKIGTNAVNELVEMCCYKIFPN